MNLGGRHRDFFGVNQFEYRSLLLNFGALWIVFLVEVGFQFVKIRSFFKYTYGVS